MIDKVCTLNSPYASKVSQSSINNYMDRWPQKNGGLNNNSISITCPMGINVINIVRYKINESSPLGCTTPTKILGSHLKSPASSCSCLTIASHKTCYKKNGMRQSPVSSIINWWEKCKFHNDDHITKHVITWEFPFEFYKILFSNNMTRMIEIMQHKVSQNNHHETT